MTKLNVRTFIDTESIICIPLPYQDRMPLIQVIPLEAKEPQKQGGKTASVRISIAAAPCEE